MRNSSTGFTLIEALIAMSISSILIGITVPACLNSVEATHAMSARTELSTSLARAETHALMTATEVVLCPGNAESGCRQSTDWSKGWIAFADIDGNRQRSAVETLLHSTDALHGKVHLRSTTGRTRLVFQPGGSNAGSNVTFTLCDGRGPHKAINVLLANNGRLRSVPAAPVPAAACMLPM